MKTKKCIKCNKVKPLTEFYKELKSKDGFRRICKVCCIKYQREWYKNNIEKSKETKKEYYKKNLEKIKKYNKKNAEKFRERKKKWRKNNAEKVKKADKKFKKNNPKKFKEYYKRYYKKNAEKEKERHIKYRKDNPEKVKETKRKYYENNTEKVKENHKKWRINNIEKFRKYRRKYHKKLSKNPSYKINDAVSTGIRLSLKGNKAGRHWEFLVGYTLKDLMKHLEIQFDKNMNWNNYGSYWWIDHIKPRSLFNFISPEDKDFKECWALENLQPLEAIANIKKGAKYNANKIL